MKRKYSPILNNRSVFTLIVTLFFGISGICQVNAQSKQYLLRSTTGNAAIPSFISSDNKQYVVMHSVGQMGVIGTYFEEDYTLRQGFIQPNVLAKIVDKNIPLELNSVIYPNPFEDGIQIMFNEEIVGDIEVTVYSMLGSVIFSTRVSPKRNIKVPLYNLSSASYILKVRANNKLLVKSIIKR